MVSFLVEAYRSGAHANRLDEIASRLRLAAEEVSRSSASRDSPLGKEELIHIYSRLEALCRKA